MAGMELSGGVQSGRRESNITSSQWEPRGSRQLRRCLRPRKNIPPYDETAQKMVVPTLSHHVTGSLRSLRRDHTSQKLSRGDNDRTVCWQLRAQTFNGVRSQNPPSWVALSKLQLLPVITHFNLATRHGILSGGTPFRSILEIREPPCNRRPLRGPEGMSSQCGAINKTSHLYVGLNGYLSLTG